MKVTTFNSKCTWDNKNTVPFWFSLVTTCLSWREPQTVHPVWASNLRGSPRREKRGLRNLFPSPLYLFTWLTRTDLFTFRFQINCHFLWSSSVPLASSRSSHHTSRRTQGTQTSLRRRLGGILIRHSGSRELPPEFRFRESGMRPGNLCVTCDSHHQETFALLHDALSTRVDWDCSCFVYHPFPNIIGEMHEYAFVEWIKMGFAVQSLAEMSMWLYHQGRRRWWSPSQQHYWEITTAQ